MALSSNITRACRWRLSSRQELHGIHRVLRNSLWTVAGVVNCRELTRRSLQDGLINTAKPEKAPTHKIGSHTFTPEGGEPCSRSLQNTWNFVPAQALEEVLMGHVEVRTTVPLNAA